MKTHDGSGHDLHRLVRFGVHRSLWLSLLSLLVVAANLILANFVPVLAVVALPVLALAVPVCMSVAFLKHDKGFCLTCVDDIPDDGATEAESRYWLFSLLHLTRAYLTWAFGLLHFMVLAGCLLLVLRHEILGLWLITSPVPLSALLFPALLTHTRLQPWCPFCQDDDGDDDETEDVPDPEPVGYRHA